MDVVATARYVRQSPRKIRLVANSVAKMSPEVALQALKLTNLRAAKIVEDVLQSAIANATHNFQLQATSLRILHIEIGEGPMLKRVRARSRGIQAPVHKHTSHVRIVLTDDPKPIKKSAASALVLQALKHKSRELHAKKRAAKTQPAEALHVQKDLKDTHGS